MKTKLDQLTMAQFIELSCGDTSMLVCGREIVSPTKLAKTTHKIICEYRELSDESGFNLYIRNIKEMLRIKTDLVIYSLCNAILQIGADDNVRQILECHGINVGSMSDQRLKAEVKSRLERAKNGVKKFEEDDENAPDIKDIRKSFDEQTAAMIAHYKFQIDTTTMKATLYAHLVARFNREVKAQMAALKKK